jgi:hypothetical protein
VFVSERGAPMTGKSFHALFQRLGLFERKTSESFVATASIP